MHARLPRVRSATTLRADLLTWEWFVDGSLVLLGEVVREPDGFRVVPEAPFFAPDAKTVGPGAFQLSLRYEELRADRDALRGGFATGTDRVRAVTCSGHWYAWREVRLTVSYTYSDFHDRVTASHGRRHGDEHAAIIRFASWF
ncbi:MAG: hypothetical protein AB7N76_36440 [Planctomycetota bacterium]